MPNEGRTLIGGQFVIRHGKGPAGDLIRFQLLRAYVTNANLRWYAVLTPYEWEQVQKFDASWTKLDEHRGVLFLRLAGD